MFGILDPPDRVSFSATFCSTPSFSLNDPKTMPGDEKMRKDHDESESDEEEELEVVPQVDIDVTKLSALSPEVISKQVSTDRVRISSFILKSTFRLP